MYFYVVFVVSTQKRKEMAAKNLIEKGDKA
jgi:hypothetical protein